MRENEVAKVIVDVAYQIHTTLGPGLLEIGFRADIIAEQCAIVELKSVEQVAPVHKKQLLTYLRLTNCHLGLLINFNTELIKNGISRVVNKLPE